MLPRAVWGGLSLASASAALGHDFWIQPERWHAAPATPVEMSLQVGHGPYRQRSPIAASRIIRLEALAAGGMILDLRGKAHLGAPASDITVKFKRPGTYVFVLETDNRAESHLPALRYNDYLRVEGLTPALLLRARTGRADADGSENYSRHAKAIIQVGPPHAGAEASIVKPVGMELEIVPERSPFAIPRARELPVRIVYRGRPLAGALVKLTDLGRDSEPVEMRRSDMNGRAVFTMPQRGSWLINVIWTRPQPASGINDFETDFSSLAFGFDGPGNGGAP